jgi:hypothetical protein
MASLNEILSALQNAVTATNNLGNKVAAAFPQAAAVSTATVTAGSIVYTSSQAAGFLTVTTSSGGVYKVPLY